jgi:hypothetical protein
LNAGARIPDGHVRAVEGRHEAALVVAEPSRLNEATAREIEEVPVHRARDAIAVAFPLGEAGARVIARVFDRNRDALDEAHEDVERRILEPHEGPALEASPRNTPDERHRPTPRAA